jgi:putative intracellular protease/amidase
MAQHGKVLFIMSGADYIMTKSGKTHETGFFLKELGQPLMKVLEAGYDVEFANPTGKTPHMDPMSDSVIWFIPYLAEKEREKQLLEKMSVENNFNNPRRFAAITDQELENYAGVFIPGGHAPMTDLTSDKDLGRILLHFHRRGKPTGSICHGPVAFLSTKAAEPDQPWAYKGYHMTCYSNMEEKTNELMFRDKLQFKAEDVLRENGAIMEEAFPMMPKVTVDRELVTGQQPTSAYPVGEKFVEVLQKAQAGSAAAAH